MGGFALVVEPGCFFAQGLEPGCFGAESADLLRGGFGDEVVHRGILSQAAALRM